MGQAVLSISMQHAAYTCTACRLHDKHHSRMLSPLNAHGRPLQKSWHAIWAAVMAQCDCAVELHMLPAPG